MSDPLSDALRATSAIRHAATQARPPATPVRHRARIDRTVVLGVIATAVGLGTAALAFVGLGVIFQ